MTDMVKVCDYCGEVIEPGAPAVQTASVDAADLMTGYNGSRLVASRARSYHWQQPNCYRRMLAKKRSGEASASVRSENSVAEETHQWSSAFDMTADEALSGRRVDCGTNRQRQTY